jgi:chemotaxis-related protein WspD
MDPRSNKSAVPNPAILNDCWNRIGVRGDSSCPELQVHVHCRNCPVYSAAAANLLDVEPPPDYLPNWTRHVAREKQIDEAATHSVVVFRIGEEWLALPTAVFREITGIRAIHSIPHRRNYMVMGVAVVRGELLVCVSLRLVLGLDPTVARKRERNRVLEERLLVIEHEGSRTACPVDEVFGIQRYHLRELTEVPAIISKAASTYTKSVLPWQGKSVGILDDQLLFYTFDRSLALATAT